MPLTYSITAYTLLLSFLTTCSAFGPSIHVHSPRHQSRLFWRRRDKDNENNRRRNDDVDRNYEWWKSRERFSPENLQGNSNQKKQQEWGQSQEWMNAENGASSSEQPPSSSWEWNTEQPFIFDAEFKDVPSAVSEPDAIIEEDLPFSENDFEQTFDSPDIFEQVNTMERPYNEQPVDSPFPWNDNKVAEKYNQAPIQPLEPPVRRRRPRTRTQSQTTLQKVDLVQRGKQERQARQYNRNIRQTQQHVQLNSKIAIRQKIATIQSGLVGAVVGSMSMAPLAALHHFVLFPTYSSTAQWEWDTGTALIQGGLFAILHRYISGNEETVGQAMQTFLLSTVSVIRTVVRVQVPMYCTALPLECGESSSFLDWNILGQLSIHFVESVYLFGAVAATMDCLLYKEWILPYQNIASNNE